MFSKNSSNNKTPKPFPNKFDCQPYFEEFESLTRFIASNPPAVRNPLSYFIYPFYVYISLILLFHDKCDEGKEFILKYSKLFLQSKGYASKISKLSAFRTIQEAWEDSYFMQFSNKKYSINVAENIVQCLQSHLLKSKSEILSSVLDSYFSIKLVNDASDSRPSDTSHESEVTEPRPHDTTDQSEHTESQASSPVTDESEDSKVKTQKFENKSQYTERLKKPAQYAYHIACDQECLCAADFDFQNNLLACGFTNSSIQMWRLEANDEGTTPTKVLRQRLEGTLSEHKGPVNGLAFSSAHSLLMSCSEDSSVIAWCMKDLKSVAAYGDTPYPVWDISVRFNSLYFATASADTVTRLYNFERNFPIRIFAGHSESVDCVEFHPNSQYIATASSDRTLRLWSVREGRCVRQFDGHRHSISSIAFAPDGRHLASADDNGCIKLWDLSSSSELQSICAHEGRVLSIDYSANASMLASGGFDQKLKTWDMRHSNPSVVDCQNVDSTVHHVAFNADVLFSVSS